MSKGKYEKRRRRRSLVLTPHSTRAPDPRPGRRIPTRAPVVRPVRKQLQLHCFAEEKAWIRANAESAGMSVHKWILDRPISTRSPSPRPVIVSSPGHRPDRAFILLLVSVEQKAAVERCAAEAGLSVSRWIMQGL
jgi:hypothetical protein